MTVQPAIADPPESGRSSGKKRLFMTETAKSHSPAGQDDDPASSSASDLVGIWQILAMGRGAHAQLFTALGLILAGSAAVMVSAMVMGRLVEALTSGHRGGADHWRLAAAFLGLEASAVVAQYFGRVRLARATIEVIFRVRCELFAKMQRLPIAYFDAQPLGRTITRLTSDVDGIETFFSTTLARVLIAVINIAVVLTAMLVADPRFGALIVAASLPAVLGSVAFRAPVIRWLRTYKSRSARLNSQLAEFLAGMPVIRLFGLERWSQQQFDSGAASLMAAGIAAMNWNSVIRPMAVFLCSLPTLLVLWLGGERVLAGAMELGVLVALIRYSERFVSPIRVLSTEVQNIQEAVVSAERVRRMLREVEEGEVLGQDGEERPRLTGEVVYDDVWMSYAGGEPVLKGVSFEVKPGMKVGFVGTTGSGKTSTINLLPRLYPYQRGHIRLDGMPVESLNRAHLRSQLGYVSQDVVVVAGTLRANLLAALPSQDISDDELLAACAKSGLAERLATYPAGLDHQIIEHGANLSMGERQLLACTRMLLRDPAILILDEATANIDEDCERLIQEAITQVMVGRTCFVIAHRLSTIRQCDLILVFSHGSIIERGTHDELMAKGGAYTQLAGHQCRASAKATEAAKLGGMS